jgi:hypothetical protein
MPPYQLLADLVLVLHVALVAFVVFGLVLILIGNLGAWRGINARWFRLLHLTAIGVVVAEAWFRVTCPLTALEVWLRSRARADSYSGSFIEHWVGRMLYYEAPSWVFTLGYSLFGLLVAAAWWYFPPTPRRRDRAGDVKSSR